MNGVSTISFMNTFRNSISFLKVNQTSDLEIPQSVNQLKNITNDSRKEISVVFCDITKAFHRVLDRGLQYKLAKSGISGSLLKWFESYLNNIKQRIVFNSEKSECGFIKSGVPKDLY